MSQIFKAIYRKRTKSHRLSLVLISSVFGAVLLAMFSGAASAQSDSTIGRGFTGVVRSVGTDGLLTIESKGSFFQLSVTGGTVINNPPDKDVGWEGLPADIGFRIAGLVDIAITDASGNVTPELLTAQKITVIPGRATRSHRRTVAVDKQGDDLTTLDEHGVRTDLPGHGAGFEKGDNIIILVQRSGRGGIGERVRGLFKAKIIGDRLHRLAQAEVDDVAKADVIAALRKRLHAAQDQRLQRTAEHAGATFREFVENTVRTFRESTDRHRGIGEVIFDCARSKERQLVTGHCLTTADAVITDTATTESLAIRITSPSSGRVVAANDVVTVTAQTRHDDRLVSVTFNVAGSDLARLTEGPYAVDVTVPTGVSSVEIKATAVDAAGSEVSDTITLRVARAADVGVKITSPAADAIAFSARSGLSRLSTASGSSEPIAEGDTIDIRAEVTGTGAITVVFTTNGMEQPPIFAAPYAMRYLVPLTPADEPPPALKITAVATDGSGNTASDSVRVTIVRKTTEVNVTITNPPADAKLKAGDTIVIRAQTDDDSKIAFVTFTVAGIETVRTSAPFTHTYILPRRATSDAAVSTIPPHVFVGKAMLDGVPAPDGTVVIAWIDSSDATTLNIKVTATANSGDTGSASLSLRVSGSMNVGEAKVLRGEYILNAAQPSGQNFAGQTVTFTVGGKDAPQTATWQKGDADVLNLTAN